MDVMIRPYQASDEAALFELIHGSREHLARWLPWCHPAYHQAETREWIAFCLSSWQARTGFRYLICNRADGRLLGGIGLEQIDWRNRVGEVGYWVAAPAINQGVATAAARQLCQLGFTEYGLQRLEIYVLPDNQPSNRVASKLGATFEGTLRHRLRYHDQPVAANCYSLIPGDLR